MAKTSCSQHRGQHVSHQPDNSWRNHNKGGNLMNFAVMLCFGFLHTHIYILYYIYRDPCVCVWHMLHKSKSFKKTTYEIATSHHSWTFTERSLLLPTESKSLGSTAKLQASCLGMAAPRYRHGFDANPQDFPLAMANLTNQHIDILR